MTRYLIRTKFTLLSISLVMMLFTASCTSGSDNGNEEEIRSQEPDQSSVRIEIGENSPDIEGAEAVITSPGQGSILKKGQEVYVTVDTRNFETGVQTETERAGEIANSGKGQHVHVIVDNKPYIAVYEMGKSISVGNLEPGPHTIFAFPSRSYHESVKSPQAADIRNFYVGEAGGDFELTEQSRSIIYSRPKGEYKGAAAKKIMLDFYLNNVELSSDGYKARYTIKNKDGSGDEYSVTIEKWTPAFIYNLPTGEYTVTLQLIDEEGNVVEGNYNSTQRDISVVTE